MRRSDKAGSLRYKQQHPAIQKSRMKFDKKF